MIAKVFEQFYNPCLKKTLNKQKKGSCKFSKSRRTCIEYAMIAN